MNAWVAPKAAPIQRTPDSQCILSSVGLLAQVVRPRLRIAFHPISFHSATFNQTISPSPLYVMFSCIVFVCLGRCHGCEPLGAHAFSCPEVQDLALEYYTFHRLELKGKREPRQPAATPNVTINVITDHYRWLLGDFTEVELIRTTALSFFPPGSRAAVPKLPMENISDVSVITCHLADEDTENAGGSLKAETSKWWHILRKMTSPWIWGSVVTATIVVALCTKRPEHGGPLSELQRSCRPIPSADCMPPPSVVSPS